MYYKLLTEDMKTRKGCVNEMDWSDVGQWHEATGERGQGLCSDEYLHGYSSFLLAVLLNPIHANITNPVCFEAEIDGDYKSDGLKFGTRRMRLVKKIDLPIITTKQRAKFAILCAKAVVNMNTNPKMKIWNEWADNWLSGKDQGSDAAYAAADAAYAAYAAAYAAAHAADAAYAAAHAAAYAAYAAYAAAHAADAAYAAYAAYAAADAADAAKKIDFDKIIEEAMK